MPDPSTDLPAVAGMTDAMAKAGRLLAARPRSVQEMRRKLGASGFDPGVTEQAISRLDELGLLDDQAFARQWVEERSRSKRRSRRALLHELAAKGITGDTAEDAVADMAGDETLTATDLAARYVRRVASRPLAAQAAAISTMLARRGFSSEVVEAAVRAVLPPEGWD